MNIIMVRDKAGSSAILAFLSWWGILLLLLYKNYYFKQLLECAIQNILKMFLFLSADAKKVGSLYYIEVQPLLLFCCMHKCKRWLDKW